MGGVTSTRLSYGLSAPLSMSRVDCRQLWLLPLTLWVVLATPLMCQASALPPASTQVTVSHRLLGGLESWHCRGLAEPWAAIRPPNPSLCHFPNLSFEEWPWEWDHFREVLSAPALTSLGRKAIPGIFPLSTLLSLASLCFSPLSCSVLPDPE